MFLRLLIILIIAAIAGAVFFSISSDDVNSPLVRGLAKIQTLKKEAGPEPATETAVYKWQDKNGEWHFSNQPPPEGAAASVSIYRSDVNIVSAPAATPPPVEKTATTPNGDPATPPLIPLADPGQVKQLIDDAKNVQNLMNDRQPQIDGKIDQR